VGWFLMTCLVCLMMPAVLWAQPFDLGRLRRCFRKQSAHRAGKPRQCLPALQVLVDAKDFTLIRRGIDMHFLAWGNHIPDEPCTGSKIVSQLLFHLLICCASNRTLP
jgi:hypothetical protein